MKLYTKTGDSGETGLFGGKRVSKADPRIESYGTLDELNAQLGVVLASKHTSDLATVLTPIQSELFSFGCHLATPYQEGDAPSTLPQLNAEPEQRLEDHIDQLSASLPELTNFIIPGGTEAAAELHLARTICRRAERCIVQLAEHDWIDPLVVRYINRLSDLLFVLARAENHAAGKPDTIWES